MEVNNKRQHYVRVFSPDGGWGEGKQPLLLSEISSKRLSVQESFEPDICAHQHILYAYTSKHACIHTYILMDKYVQDMH